VRSEAPLENVAEEFTSEYRIGRCTPSRTCATQRTFGEIAAATGERFLMAVSLSREFLLTAACSVWPPSHSRTEAIRAAAAGPLDWDRFLRVVTRQRVVGLVHDGLTRAQPPVPPGVASEIATRAAASVRQNLALAAEAVRLQNLFTEADIPVVFIKGASLSMLAFGTLGLSGGQDIDLLVPRETLSAASALVARAGYHRFDPPANLSDEQLRLLLPLRKDLGFIHVTTRLQIELHWRLFLNPHAMDETWLTEASRIVPLAGAAGLRTLGEEDLFAYLCIHGALHWWNRLKWLADVNALLASTPERGIERLLLAAEAKGAGRAAAQALLLCRRLLGTPLPSRPMISLGTSATVRWLEATALNAMTRGEGEHDPHDTRFGTTRGSLSTFLLKRSWRYWLAEINVHLTNQTDVLTLPLPKRLQFLYPLLRLPLWAWRHFAKRRQ
jgi:hypothetical protein